jgi:hypothetical protein
MIQKADQDRSSFALGFQRAMETKSPVAVIAGKARAIASLQICIFPFKFICG